MQREIRDRFIWKKTMDNAFEIDYRLDVPVRSDIYDYIVSD